MLLLSLTNRIPCAVSIRCSTVCFKSLGRWIEQPSTTLWLESDQYHRSFCSRCLTGKINCFCWLKTIQSYKHRPVIMNHNCHSDLVLLSWSPHYVMNLSIGDNTPWSLPLHNWLNKTSMFLFFNLLQTLSKYLSPSSSFTTDSHRFTLKYFAT